MKQNKEKFGKGWYEDTDPTCINKKGKPVARRHHDVAAKKDLEHTIRTAWRERSKAEREADANITAENTFGKDNEKRVKEWAKRPNHSDLWGVDTKAKNSERKEPETETEERFREKFEFGHNIMESRLKLEEDRAKAYKEHGYDIEHQIMDAEMAKPMHPLDRLQKEHEKRFEEPLGPDPLPGGMAGFSDKWRRIRPYETKIIGSRKIRNIENKQRKANNPNQVAITETLLSMGEDFLTADQKKDAEQVLNPKNRDHVKKWSKDFTQPMKGDNIDLNGVDTKKLKKE